VQPLNLPAGERAKPCETTVLLTDVVLGERVNLAKSAFAAQLFQ